MAWLQVVHVAPRNKGYYVLGLFDVVCSYFYMLALQGIELMTA